jgi:uncharacterized protein YrrD
MKLTKDAKIRAADGESIGNLNRFVVNPKTKRVSHVVFEHGMLSKTERVIPMELVERVDDDGIHLRAMSEKVEDLPLFEEDKYLLTNERALLDEGLVSDTTVYSYYHYPPAPYGTSSVRNTSDDLHTYHQTEQKPRVERSMSREGHGKPIIGSEKQNIPEGTVGLKEGAKVVSSDQKHVGDVEKLFMDPQSDTATHLLITKGLLNREKKLVPVDWIDQILEDEVSLVVQEDFVDNLPNFEENK